MHADSPGRACDAHHVVLVLNADNDVVDGLRPKIAFNKQAEASEAFDR